MKRKCLICKRGKAGHFYDAYDNDDFAREVRALIDDSWPLFRRLIVCEPCIEQIRIKLVDQGLNYPTAPPKVVKSRFFYKGLKYYKLSEEQKKIHWQALVQPPSIYELPEVRQQPELLDNPLELVVTPSELTSQPLELVDNSVGLLSKEPVTEYSFSMFMETEDFKKPMPFSVKRKIFEIKKMEYRKRMRTGDNSSKENISNESRSIESCKSNDASNSNKSINTESFNGGGRITSTQISISSLQSADVANSSYVRSSEEVVTSSQTSSLSPMVRVSVKSGHMRVLKSDSSGGSLEEVIQLSLSRTKDSRVVSHNSSTSRRVTQMSYHPIVLNDSIISGNASNYSSLSNSEHSNVAAPKIISLAGREHSNVAAPVRITNIRKNPTHGG